jgi:biofilm PGA synthesis N-glycosyltransferase PgaC
MILNLMAIAVIYLAYYRYMQHLVRAKTMSTLSQTVVSPDEKPRLTIIIPTYNEESTIEGKLNDLIAQQYPLDKMELVVFDSGSTDKTPDVVESFRLHHRTLNLILIRESKREGKSVALNKAIQKVSPTSQIVLVTDSDSRLGRDSLNQVVESFRDPRVGLVTGVKLVFNPAETTSTKLESSYRNLYSVLRQGESVLDSTPICDGELIASKRSLMQSVRVKDDVNADDTQLSILTRRAGFRSICNPNATLYEFAPPTLKDLWRQKVRRGQGIVRTLWMNRDMLFNRKYGRFGTLIFPMNFFMHILSPIILVAMVALCAVVFAIEFGILPVILVSIAAVAVLMSTRQTRISSTMLAFISYQMILLAAIILAMTGKSLHKWQKISSSRDQKRWTILDSAHDEH